ncbi:hypothetical protein LIER_31333 [Lithospermum erythrorhizon]|uniref:Uncharacterized protein n=1 Tax=Lithospermum erythrorhizon TaxID=34254 RepID=A0AAV3RSP2_LITER
MDEEGISSVFEDRLNPSLYDERVYVREYPYARNMDIETRLESPATHHCDSTSSTSSSTNASDASSPSPQPSILDKGTLITASLTHVDVMLFNTSIKGMHLAFVCTFTFTLTHNLQALFVFSKITFLSLTFPLQLLLSL